MGEQSFIQDIAKMPLFAITVLMITAIAVYFDVPLMIPPFAATLFMIFLREGSEFSHFKNVFGGHLIGFGFAFLEPFVMPYMDFMPYEFARPLIISLAVLLAGWTMAITRLEHPPAVATTLLFFEMDKSGKLLFGVVPFNTFISFIIGLIFISYIAFYVFKKEM
jgi:CBS-domain-containing membrane protein